ncbi:MAG TPA: hypothetical protein VI792_09375 [Candidatus Eisenbacteria bacterium]
MSRAGVGSVAGLALAGVLGAFAGEAEAVAPPDVASMARLQAACDSAWRVRLVGRRATYTLERPALDASGVSLEHPSAHPAIVTVGEPAPGRRLAWSEIERLETARSPWPGRVLVGAGIGAAVGATALAVFNLTVPDSEGATTALKTTVMAIPITLGALFGAATPATHPLYP